MNKRGVVGKLLSIVPIMFLIFIIMGIFVLLASAGSITKAKAVFNTETITGSNPMEREIIVSGSKIEISEALGNFADVYIDYKRTFDENPESALAQGKDKAYNNAYLALLKGLEDFIDSDGQIIGVSSDLCLVLSAKIGGQFGRGEFKETTKYPAGADFGKDAFVFYIERKSSGSLSVLSKDFGIFKGSISQEYVIILNNYSRAVRTFSLLTKGDNELNGVYHYGGCLKK